MARTRETQPNPAAEPDAPAGPLQIRYVRLSESVRWDRNPKKWDMGGIMTSIRQHGFRDAPIYDSTLGAIVAGNGRTTALEELRREGAESPAGIHVDAEGEWWMPMQFGLDAPSREAAESFGLAHNLLTASGGNLGLPELAGLFEHDALVAILADMQASGTAVPVLDPDDIEALLRPLQLEQGGRPGEAPQRGPGGAEPGYANVRMQQLFFKVEEFEQFVADAEVVQRYYETETLTDTVMRAVGSLAAQIREELEAQAAERAGATEDSGEEGEL